VLLAHASYRLLASSNGSRCAYFSRGHTRSHHNFSLYSKKARILKYLKALTLRVRIVLDILLYLEKDGIITSYISEDKSKQLEENMIQKSKNK